jgi:hypothetical protein
LALGNFIPYDILGTNLWERLIGVVSL